MKSTDLVDNQYIRTDVPDFASGDEVKVHVKVVEGNKERVQVFHGNVIRRQGSGVAETYTVRKAQLRRRCQALSGAHTHCCQARGHQAWRRSPSSVLPACRVGKPPRSRKSATPERSRSIGVIEHPL
jgi:hypothetical protein